MALFYPTENTSFNSSADFSALLEYPTYSFFNHQTAAPPLCLPEGIRLVNTGYQVTVICCRSSISKGTRFGPYRGNVVQPSQIKEGQNNEFLWEVRI